MSEDCAHGSACHACPAGAGSASSEYPAVPRRRRAVLLELAVDAAIRTCGGWPVPAADPFSVLQRAFALGVTDADYDEALAALQARLAVRGYPRYFPPLRWIAH